MMSSNTHSTNHAPSRSFTHLVDSASPYKGRKYPTKEVARLEKLKLQKLHYQAKKPESIPVAKRSYTRRLRIPEGVSAEEATLARKEAKKKADKASHLKNRGERDSSARKLFNAHQAEQRRLRYAESKAKILAEAPAVQTMGHNELEASSKTTSIDFVATHAPASPSSLSEVEPSGSSHQRKPQLGVFSSAAKLPAADEGLEEDWLQFLAPELQ